MKQRVRAQRGIQVVHQDDVGGRIQTLAFRQHPHARQYLLELLVAAFRDMHLVRFFVDPVIALTFFIGLARQQLRNLIDAHVGFGVIFGRARDDQRCPRFVDQDRINLVDNRV